MFIQKIYDAIKETQDGQWGSVEKSIIQAYKIIADTDHCDLPQYVPYDHPVTNKEFGVRKVRRNMKGKKWHKPVFEKWMKNNPKKREQYRYRDGCSRR